MTSSLRRVLLAGVVLAGSLVLPVLAAPAAQASFGDCMEIATDFGADPWVAHDACDSDTLTGCFRILSAEYGSQPWVLEACKAR